MIWFYTITDFSYNNKKKNTEIEKKIQNSKKNKEFEKKYEILQWK